MIKHRLQKTTKEIRHPQGLTDAQYTEEKITLTLSSCYMSQLEFTHKTQVRVLELLKSIILYRKISDA